MPVTLHNYLAGLARAQVKATEKMRHIHAVVLPGSQARIVRAELRLNNCVRIELEMARRCQDDAYRR